MRTRIACHDSPELWLGLSGQWLHDLYLFIHDILVAPCV